MESRDLRLSPSPDPELLFSVIVPFLNERRLLPECIQALENQTLDRSRFELIFVDNGSSDGSAEIVARSPQITILRETERDPYLARNRGIAAARGAYLAFLDADCIPNGDWLQTFWTEIQNSDPAIVMGYVAYPNRDSFFLRCYEEFYDQKLKHLMRRGLKRHFFGHAGNMVIRADVFRELGAFAPLPIVGDTEIIHRLLKHQPHATILYLDRARVLHAEVTNFRVCLSKLFDCGEYCETLSRISDYAPIPLIEKIRIFYGCVRDRKYGPSMVLATLVTLGVGWCSYVAGRTARFWFHARHRGARRSATASRQRSAEEQ